MILENRMRIKTLWMTGLSGSGKSTIAEELLNHVEGSWILDGDVVRTGLCKDLGFSLEDRKENIRRIAEVSKILNDVGIQTIVPVISPTIEIRKMARDIIGEGFIEIYVSTSLEECERRDVKGLYKKVRAGEIPQFTGITSPYEPPENPDILLDTETLTLEEEIRIILDYLK
jgi:bifunctional enzyme CysN/CysC